MAKKYVRTKVDIEGTVHEVLVEVPDTEAPPWPSEPGPLSEVGRPRTRVDGFEKVTGEARYTYDMYPGGVLHGRILHSTIARGRVKRLDASRARALPGVAAVVTAEDVPPLSMGEGREWKVLFSEIGYEGQEIAAVCAIEEEIAEEALSLIEVEYEDQPFVHSLAQAMEDGAPSLGAEGNVIPTVSWERGSVERGFAEADVIVEETFTTQVNVHQCLESHVCVADWDGDGVTVHASTQGIFTLRNTLAGLLGIPLSKVRVVQEHMGGGFGSKLYYGPSVLDRSIVLAVLLSRRTGRPVKFATGRENESKNTGHRPATLQRFKIGAKRDGKLTAIELRTHLTLDNSCSRAAASAYACPNMKVQEHMVLANFSPPRPVRAPGNVQNTFAMEMTMDRLAERLGMDPLELRRVNYAESDPRDGRPWALKGLEECYRRGAEAIGWGRRNRRAGEAPAGAGPKRRGLGVATGIWEGSAGLPASAIVRVNADGTVNVLAGTQDLGTGTKTIMSMVVAEELGLRLQDVAITVGDTGVCPPGPLSGGSLTVPSVTPAVRNAARDARERVLALAIAMEGSPFPEASPEDLEAAEGTIRMKADPSRSVPFRQVAAAMGRDYVFGTGDRGPNREDVSISTFTAQFAEVEVDVETGIVEVKKIVSAHDSGRILNPLTASNQVEGGAIQGMAFALQEERIMDPTTGRMANPNLHDYKIPTAAEIPEIVPIFVDRPDVMANNAGVKGLGEPPIIPTSAAIACAVYNATGAFVRDLPLTPRNVLAALEESEAPRSGRRA